jgi:plasmid stabilization system protein ParE
MRLRWTDPAANDLYDNDLYDIVQHIQQDNPDKATDSLRRLRKPDQISVSRPQGTNRRN